METNYKVIKGAVQEQTLQLIKETLLMSKDVDYFLNSLSVDNRTAFGDSQSQVSYSSYGHHSNESLMKVLLPIVEEATGKKLLPTYTYSRIYWEGSTLEKHTDRPSCEYSVSLCVEHDGTPWPIFFDGNELVLDKGDIVVYKGMVSEHWREPYKGKQQIQIFMHYVDSDGPHAEWSLDKRPMLGLVKR